MEHHLRKFDMVIQKFKKSKQKKHMTNLQNQEQVSRMLFFKFFQMVFEEEQFPMEF